MKIFIAEDDPVSRRVLEMTLKRWNYEVLVTEAGDAAWACLQEPDCPHLLILDWMMPAVVAVLGRLVV